MKLLLVVLPLCLAAPREVKDHVKRFLDEKYNDNLHLEVMHMAIQNMTREMGNSLLPSAHSIFSSSRLNIFFKKRAEKILGYKLLFLWGQVTKISLIFF